MDMDSAVAGERWTSLGVFSMFLYVVPLVANCTMLAAVAAKRIKKKDRFEELRVVDLIIINICIADGVVALAYVIGYIWTGANFSNSNTACRFIGFFVSSFTGASVTFLFMLAYSRYSIVKNTAGFPWIKACKIAAVVWSIGLSYGIYLTATNIVELSPTGLYCLGGYDRQNALKAANGITAVILVFGPSVGIIWFYSAILGIVKTNAKDYELVKKMAKMCAVLSSIYTLSVLPYGVSIVYSLVTGEFLPHAWDAFAFAFVSVNFWSNPIAYCVYQRRYRKAVFDLLGLSQALIYLGYGEMQNSSQKLSSISLEKPKNMSKDGGVGGGGADPPEAALVTDKDSAHRSQEQRVVTAQERPSVSSVFQQISYGSGIIERSSDSV